MYMSQRNFLKCVDNSGLVPPPHHFPHRPPPVPFLLSPRCDPQGPSRHQLKETKPSDQYPHTPMRLDLRGTSLTSLKLPPIFSIKSLIRQLPGSWGEKVVYWVGPENLLLFSLHNLATRWRILCSLHSPTGNFISSRMLLHLKSNHRPWALIQFRYFK